ncbi:TIGR04290 family methyltransferase [Aurantimonas sp. VKM B-3413]|uniref:TIGR04290 family methyltransferase n=1 Tax=Aurantimonas sp. VKM B-3413 TaxID=2779401 RepID=UPI001E5E3DCB|nr:TIGR04290 family methyltransferase [Aurantimonas sp. VKM B-3413]MCB8839359.1 TIGR04290 family methyltransferase [Aurantimonas sp. VKM B-3413]
MDDAAPAPDIEQRVRDLDPWFHNLDLAGVRTAPDHFLGDYPNFKWQRFRHLVPERLDGLSVLDIGCNAGFYSLEMKRRGAERVVGIDSDPRYLAQARLAAEIAGLEIEFVQMSVYDVGALQERFDFVIFMGVLYHLRHPLLALDLLYETVVGGDMLFQSMLRGSAAVPEVAADYPFEETAIFEREGYPRMVFVEQNYSGDPTNWWIPNRAGMEAMLRSSGFCIVGATDDEVYLCRRGERGFMVEPPPPIETSRA